MRERRREKEKEIRERKRRGKEINQARRRDVGKGEGRRGEEEVNTGEHGEHECELQRTLQRAEEGAREQTTRTPTCISVTVSSSFSFGKRRAYRPPEVLAYLSSLFFKIVYAVVLHTLSSQ